MPTHFIMVVTTPDGGIRHIEKMSRNEAIRFLMRPGRGSHGALEVTPGDSEGAVLVKEALKSVGGVRQLSYRLQVTREAIYNWVKRGGAPAWQETRLREVIEAQKASDPFEASDDDDEDGGE